MTEPADGGTDPAPDPDTDPGTDPGPVAATVGDYYEALRRGEPLYPYFAEDPATAKVGIGETLAGYEAAAEALREQTRLTDDWTVESHRLRAGRRGDLGWFSDLVTLAWSDEQRRSYDTRWTGALYRRDEEWVFVEMHVSVAHDPRDGGPAGFGTNLERGAVVGNAGTARDAEAAREGEDPIDDADVDGGGDGDRDADADADADAAEGEDDA